MPLLNVGSYYQDLVKLYFEISKLNFEEASKEKLIKPKIGPLSTLGYMIENSLLDNKGNNDGINKEKLNNNNYNNFDSLTSQNEKNSNEEQEKRMMLVNLFILDEYIYRWRSIAGDGNCFYRAIMFAYLENIIISGNVVLLMKIYCDINEKFNEDYFKNNNLHSNTMNTMTNLNKIMILSILLIIHELMKNNNNIVRNISNEKSINCAYKILVYSFLYNRDFDLVYTLSKTYFRA